VVGIAAGEAAEAGCSALFAVCTLAAGEGLDEGLPSEITLDDPPLQATRLNAAKMINTFIRHTRRNLLA
jgi:hypothetical protein